MSVAAPSRGGRGIGGRSAAEVDARGLAIELLNSVDGEVRFDDGTRALYSTDASNYRQVPIGVVVPRDVDGVIATIDACRRFGAPILSRGGGTSLAGQTCNTAVVIDFSKWVNRLVELDADARSARIEPGIVRDDLCRAAEARGLTFGPDPATHAYCTLGGMIGNNSCGAHSLYGGKTVDNVEELEVMTADGVRLTVGPTEPDEVERIVAGGGRRGEIYAAMHAIARDEADEIRRRYPEIPRRVSGYNLDQLLPENGFNVARALVGTESTCVTVLSAKVRLVRYLPSRVLLVLGYPDVATAADDVPAVLEAAPMALEGMDDRLIADMRRKRLLVRHLDLLPDGRAWLLAEFGAESPLEAEARAAELRGRLEGRSRPPAMALYASEAREERIWEIRESGLGATANVPGRRDTWEGWEDSAVHPERLGDYLRQLRALLDRFDYRGDFYGHFGEGCVHTRIAFDLATAEGIARYRSFIDEATDLVVRLGGSFSGEHGDGQSRAEYLEKMFGPRLIRAFERFKDAWDPEGRMNPGKVVRPYRIDENLRIGPGHAPMRADTTFGFPEDDRSFAEAAQRCVGVGKCRRTDAGTMCPSYMVTRDEQHSTRGRARLLFEMLDGRALQRGWRDEAVHDALDLCLACKGCKGECPVNVDMATYKSEFMAHYYAGRLRPRSAYSMGLIYWWAGMASRAPRLANAAAHAPVLSDIAKRLAGIAPQRPLPRFATETFRPWFARRPPRRASATRRRRVIVWPDTFNNHFHPEVARAAVTVLEDAGYEVDIPRRSLCCGRPLYDYGWLDLARRLLRQVMRELRPEIEAGTPIVGLEPSCVSTFRDELVGLFPRARLARQLSESVVPLAQLLTNTSGYEPPRRQGRAVLHGHCHQKALIGMDDDVELLRRTGLEVDVLDAGCCGLAGAFGFERQHYDVSVAAGERVLLPAARALDDGTPLIADGFSCRTQVEQLAGRRAVHLAEVLSGGLTHSASTDTPV
jgi:FAD/FMN-containing dehydrogenase/Fe-S oxidoreductase